MHQVLNQQDTFLILGITLIIPNILSHIIIIFVVLVIKIHSVGFLDKDYLQLQHHHKLLVWGMNCQINLKLVLLRLCRTHFIHFRMPGMTKCSEC